MGCIGWMALGSDHADAPELVDQADSHARKSLAFGLVLFMNLFDLRTYLHRVRLVVSR